jgi:hypothetical protein
MQARARLQIVIGTAAAMMAVPTFLAAAASDQARVLKGQWATAATEKLIPNFDWVDTSALVSPAVHPFMSDANAWFSAPLLNSKEWAGVLRVSTLSTTSGLAALVGTDLPKTVAIDAALERRLLNSGLFVQNQKGLAFGVDAVFAEQRFASGTLSPLPDRDNILPPVSPLSERSTGVGVAVAVGGPLDERFSWSLGLRSPVDMDEYKSYQGLYSEPGDLDIPATATLGFSAQLVPSTALVLGAEQVFYSDVSGVSSFALPNRFLALLGDGNSPTFAWQDLTVYSAALRGEIATWDWSVRYSTSLQPNPTSPLLQRAIEGIQSDANWSLGLGRSIGRLGEIRLSASYAGAEYVLGSPYYRNTDPAESTHFEFEALWDWRF